MNAPVFHQFLEGFSSDFATNRIERRNDNGFRCFVDDQVDAGRGFHRANVAALTTDDFTLHLIVRKIDHGDRAFRRVLRSVASDGHRDDALRSCFGFALRFFFDLDGALRSFLANVGGQRFDHLAFRFGGAES